MVVGWQHFVSGGLCEPVWQCSVYAGQCEYVESYFVCVDLCVTVWLCFVSLYLLAQLCFESADPFVAVCVWLHSVVNGGLAGRGLMQVGLGQGLGPDGVLLGSLLRVVRQMVCYGY